VAEMYSTLGLPLSRLGQYGIELAGVFDALDGRGRKSLSSAMKIIYGLSQKCSARAMQSVYH
jgi:hypothetical protein